MKLPAVGTRVVVRYRLPSGSVPPLTDVIGHVVDTVPTQRVRTKRGHVVEVAVEDVVAIKALATAPVRTGDIRAVEHAAALGWPGIEQHWVVVARAAVTEAADRSRWVGISALRVSHDQRRRGHGREVCSALLSWGVEHGAARAYTQVLVENIPAARLFELMGFAGHHRSRYVGADIRQKGGGS